MPALSAGKIAPDFTLSTLDGKPFSLAKALATGPVVISFFKITCPVCQYAFPFIERLYRNARALNATVIGISQHPKKDAALFAQEYGVTFPIVLDEPANYEVSNAYGITNVPTTFLITPGGKIEVSSVGWSRPDLAAIQSNLAERAHVSAPVLFSPAEQVIESKAG